MAAATASDVTTAQDQLSFVARSSLEDIAAATRQSYDTVTNKLAAGAQLARMRLGALRR